MNARPTRDTVAGRAYLDLRKLARQAGRATDEYLRLYALEGFLARLAVSARRGDLVVKGGALLAAYDVRRPTADVDLAGLAMANDLAVVQALVIAVAGTPPGTEDGLMFDTMKATAEVIREDNAYAGVRVSLSAKLATAELPFHVDVNVGDPIWPRPQIVNLPRLLGGEIELLGYPLPMVIAEKLVTAAQRGVANTRWRDFADIYTLAGAHEFESTDANNAIRVVADHRLVELRPLRDVLSGYAEAGQARWLAWRARQNLADRLPADFAEVVDRVLDFADGCFVAPIGTTWSPTAHAWT